MNHLELSDDDEFVIVKDWYKKGRQWRCHVLVNHPGSGWREMDGSWTHVPEVVCVRYEEHHTGELECTGLHANSRSYRYGEQPESHEQARRWLLDDLIEAYEWIAQTEGLV